MPISCQRCFQPSVYFLAVGMFAALSGACGPDVEQSAAPAHADLHTALVAARQAEAGPEYAYAKLSGPGAQGLRAENPAHGFSIELTASGVELRRAGGAATLGLSAWGCPGQLTAHRSGAPRISAHDGHRAEYQGAEPQAPLVEWYKNGPMGIEQGFLVPAQPRCKQGAGDRLELAVAVDGATSLRLAARRAGQAPSVEIAVGEEAERLIYSDLSAQDAGGNPLPAEMRVEGSQILLEIDTHGARYPISIDPLIWVQQAKLLGNDMTQDQAEGFAVAIDGDTAVVGAVGGTGSAYVFVRSPGTGTWTQQAKLTAMGGAVGDRFGQSVAIQGDTIVVGAIYANAAYVFVRPSGGTTWTQQAVLAGGSQAGSDVSISGDTIVVGAPDTSVITAGHVGAAFVFVRQSGGTTWTQQAELLNSPLNSYEGFGGRVSISGDTILIGVASDSPGGLLAAGAVYVFTRPTGGTTWTLLTTLSANDKAVNGSFGISVSLDGDTALIGSEGATISGAANAGAAYVFTRPSGGTTWTQQAKLTAIDAAAGDSLGHSVSLFGDSAVVGAYFASPGGIINAGAAYVFTRPSGGTIWTQQAKFTASDGAQSDNFGNSVSISADTVVVGAPQIFPDIGSAYVFHNGIGNGATCTMGSQCASGFCIDGVCCNSACAGGTQDCQACSQLAGAPADGTCAPLGAGAACGSGADPSHCIAGGTCNGTTATCNDTPASSTVVCDPSGNASQCIAAYQCDGQTAGSCPTINPILMSSPNSCEMDMGMAPMGGSTPSGCQCQVGKQPPVSSWPFLCLLLAFCLALRRTT